ncbi:MAG: hypothetical protein LM576_06600, partial [Thermofilum sp.]|nr:hypothetical protein [Thermofilum sp.]
MEELTAKVKKVIAALTVKEPLLGVLLKRTWILYDPKLTHAPASTDGLRIFLGPAAAQMDERRLAAALAHEVVHAALKHPTRGGLLQRKYGLPQPLLNVLADAITNKYVLETDAGKYLEELGPVLPKHIEEWFGIKDVEKKSFEELAKEVAERLPKVEVKVEVIRGKATFGEDIYSSEGREARSREGEEEEGAEGKGAAGGKGEEKAAGREKEAGGGEGEAGGGRENEAAEEGEKGGEAAPTKGKGGGAGFGEGESKEGEGDKEVVVINEGDPGEHPSNKLTEEEIERRIERKVTSAVET